MSRPPNHRILSRDRYYNGRVLSDAKDVSSPAFARHDDHVARVMDLGGFCWLSERRLSGKDVAVCLPLRWPA